MNARVSHPAALLTGAAIAAAIAVPLASSGSSSTFRPPNLGAPRAEAANPAAQPVKTAYRPELGAATPQRYTSASGCGVERWAVKTLTDPGANAVNQTPVDSTIGALVALTPPVQPTDRVAPTETTTYRLTGVITFAKQEADGDIHLVLQDTTGNSMIIESPTPSCANGSLVASQIAAVRATGEKQFPQAVQGQPQTAQLPVTVTGVGFFDRLHGQTGVAPNGIELHPLLSLQPNSGLKLARPVPDLHLQDHAGAD